MWNLPVDRNIFGETEFLAAAVTDNTVEISKNETNTEDTSVDIHETEHLPTTSEAAVHQLGTGTTQTKEPEISHSSFCISPSEIQPLPKMSEVRNPRKRKGGTAAVLTSSPYKS